MDIVIVATLGIVATALMSETVWDSICYAWDNLIDRFWRS
jgi:hypothetical protein